MRITTTLISLLLCTAFTLPASAFCGFYVAQADAGLFNEASQVVIARSGDRTVVTMASDYQGDVRDFALVVPVPTVVSRDQVNVAELTLIDHLDRYTAPRLVEYHDPNPCALTTGRRGDLMMNAAPSMRSEALAGEAGSHVLGVTVEASYSVGEYDILILSATESAGLVTWLERNGYQMPNGAAPVLESYLKQDMHFFVAKVNLGEKAALGVERLRPLQIAYESAKFMLPIRLGMVNARGHQELFVYTLTQRGRVETTNYRSVRLPTGSELPVHVRDDFGRFYQAMFARQAKRQNHRAVFVEYAWDMGWCDPCAADPLSPTELRSLGAFWVAPQARTQRRNVFVTRLHLRYDAAGFPEDLKLRETGDRSNFQGRYVIRHAYSGTANCRAGDHYRQVLLPQRQDREARNLARLTGWPIADIQSRIEIAAPSNVKWWQRLWQKAQ